jgi:hypothetical protein
MPSGQHFILQGMVCGVRASSRGWLYEMRRDSDFVDAWSAMDLHRNARVCSDPDRSVHDGRGLSLMHASVKFPALRWFVPSPPRCFYCLAACGLHRVLARRLALAGFVEVFASMLFPSILVFGFSRTPDNGTGACLRFRLVRVFRLAAGRADLSLLHARLARLGDSWLFRPCSTSLRQLVGNIPSARGLSPPMNGSPAESSPKSSP